MELSKHIQLLVAYFSLCLLSHGALGLYGPNSNVALLTPSNFKSMVNKGAVTLVEFYAPWCGHCKNLAPTWDKAASALKGVATVAAIDCDAHSSIAQEYGIQGFPTIKVFIPGRNSPLDYSGGRDAKSIVDYALQQVKSVVSARLSGKTSSGGTKEEPNASLELNADNFEESVTQSSDIWMVEFFAPWCGHCKKLAPEWKRAAKNLKGKVKLGQVDCTQEQNICGKFKVQGYPTILLFGADKESPVPYEGARVAGAIESFALEALEENVQAPEIVELTGPDVMENNCASASICFIAFLPDILDTGAAGRRSYLDTLLGIGEKFKKYSYKYVWTAAGLQPDLEKAVGVGGYGYPALVALNVKKQVFAPFKSSFQGPHLIDFVKSIRTAGSRTNVPLESELKTKSVEPWDGLDGQLPEEEEFSLDDLMVDDTEQAKEDL